MPTRIGGISVFDTQPLRPTTGPTLPAPPAPDPAPAPVRPGWGPGTGSRWMKPTYDISIPDNLGRPPRTTDVTIRKGFDGKTPDEVVATVKRNLKGALHPSNRALVERHVRENHRSFTIAVSNMFVAGSPPNRFVSQLALRNQVTVQMTMSAVQPVIIRALGPGATQPSYYGKGPNGDWVQIPAHKYAVVAEAQLRYRPEPGLKLDYPLWATPALKGPLSTVEEL